MKRLKISRRTVLDWLRQGKLPGQKIGSQWRVDADGLEAFLMDLVPNQLASRTRRESKKPLHPEGHRG
jgi:excisionase family DNA binding protein